MKAFKKLIFMAILAVMVALCSIGAVTAFADENISQTAKNVTVEANELNIQVGESATLSYMAKGYANVAGFHFIINLPSNVTFSEFKIAGVFGRGNFQHTVNGSQISVICNSGNEQISNETHLFDIEVVGREVGGGDAWFTSAFLTDVDANEIQCFANSTFIEVLGEPEEIIIKGDVDGNNYVDVQDLMLMQRYILGTLGDEVAFIISASDIDGDYDTDLIDCQQLQRYIVGKISFDELQNISNGSGSGDVEYPEYPDDPSEAEQVFDVKIDGVMCKEALRVNIYDLSAVFTYKGRELYGKACNLSMLDPNLPENSVAFIEYDGTEVFGFVRDQWGVVELEAYIDLNQLVKEQPTNFNAKLAGEYKVINAGEVIGMIRVDENGVFTGSVNIYSGSYFTININGMVTYADIKEGMATSYIFGMIPQELKCDFVNKIVSPLKNGQEMGETVSFLINYYTKDGTGIVKEVVYNMSEGEDLYSVAKMLAHQNLPEGFELADYKVNHFQDGTYQIEAWIYEREDIEGGETTQGKKITLYMSVSGDKHQMLQPMQQIEVQSSEQLQTMLDYMTQMPSETQMKFIGVYVDKQCTIPYDVSMGIEIAELYIRCEYLEGVNMVKGFGGEYKLLVEDETGMQVQTPGSLKVNEENRTFTLVMGDKDAVTYSGEIVVSGSSYNENGIPSYASIALITKNNVQISGSLISFYIDKLDSFVIHGIEDYSDKQSQEDLKKYAGEYTTYVQAMGLNMIKCSVYLQDNGVFTLQLFFMKQIGTYEFVLDATGKEVLILTADGSPMNATIDLDAKEIHIEMSMGGSSSGGSSGSMSDSDFNGEKVEVSDKVIINK